MSQYQDFKLYRKLMPYKVKDILIVSSYYDAFTMEEDGGLMTYVLSSRDGGIALGNLPRFTIASTTENALEMIKMQFFDLVVIMPRYLQVDALSFSKQLKEQSGNDKVAVVLLYHHGNYEEIDEKSRTLHVENSHLDNVFIWSGNRNILWAIIRSIEDRMNVEHDTQEAMVQVLILVDDSPRHYSSMLPMLYQEIEHQTQSLLEDGLNEEHRLLKLQARPKLLLAHNYEQAYEISCKFRQHVLCLLSDVRFPKGGKIDESAGLELIRKIKEESPYLPMCLLSSEKNNQERARELEVFFFDKNSPSLLQEMRQFFRDYLGFGDFIFRRSASEEVARVTTLAAMERTLQYIPDECLLYHASSGHHFASWFLARSHTELAAEVRQAEYKDFFNMGEIRKFLITKIRESRLRQQRGVVSSFVSGQFDPESEFLKIGKGSLGGKARGLAFMLKNIQRYDNKFQKYKNINISIPQTLVIATDIFDQFIHENRLEEFVKADCPDEIVAARFIEARLPAALVRDVKIFLEKVRDPLAVRSSGLLEDSQYQSCAGLYKTYMLPNNQLESQERMRNLLRAIKLVYASMFYQAPRIFAKVSMQRMEEEKMAITIQRVLGECHGDYFYPSISGTAQSLNYYPLGHARASEGVARISLGLGKTVVEGGQSLSFFPKHPQFLPHFSTVEAILHNAQQFFWALNIKHDQNNRPGYRELWLDDTVNLVKRSVYSAISANEGAIDSLVSYYVEDDHRLVDHKLHGGGSAPILTFANILKHEMLPLPEIITDLLEIGQEGLGRDVEIEYALNLNRELLPLTSSQPFDTRLQHQFKLLQIRPMTHRFDEEEMCVTQEDKARAVCYSTSALGRGLSIRICDLIFVKENNFTFQYSVAVAREISEFNAHLVNEKRPYILIGPGRWGSSDSNLGIPVTWEDISGVKGIVETPYKSMKIDPSQGTHFFQNITSSGVIYLTIYTKEDFLDRNWLLKQKIIRETNYIRHILIPSPLVIKIDSKSGQGILTV
ncbi:MAG: phosphoenolpyruvate synthase/pyruvate phosphate dikinase [Oligoflexia bacterium]|nr:phosphoenolpyruvate synthase/pyruvate phosphate dikinase [Oligoflexia bacterium]